jgi:hypothetical protein
MTTETDIVAQAEKTVANLEDKRRALIQKATDLAVERQRVSFLAHTGDAKARQRLNAINTETSMQASEMESIEAAIIEANARLNVARTGEALAADKANALLLREKVAQFKEHGIELGNACQDVSMWVNEMLGMLDEIHALGQPFPTSEQFRVNATNALKTLVQSLPQSWVRDFEFPLLQPSQKKDFGQLATSWSETIERQIAARLGEDNSRSAA